MDPSSAVRMCFLQALRAGAPEFFISRHNTHMYFSLQRKLQALKRCKGHYINVLNNVLSNNHNSLRQTQDGADIDKFGEEAERQAERERVLPSMHAHYVRKGMPESAVPGAPIHGADV